MENIAIAKENEMIRKAARGDEEMISALYVSYFGMIVKAGHQAKLHPVADDAVQVAITGFLTAIQEFDESRGINFAAFAKSKVYAAVQDYFRKEQRHWAHEVLPAPTEAGEDALSQAEDPRDSIGAQEMRMHLREACRMLTEKEKEVLRLTVLHDITQKRAAELLGVTAQAVGKTRRRLLRKLRGELVVA